MPSYLVLQAARFGDLVQTKRLLLTLAARGEVHLAVDEGLVPLARLLYPFARLHALAVHGAPSAAALDRNRAVLAHWRGMSFDGVYNCNYSPLTTALCRVFPMETVCGYRPEQGRIARSPWARIGFALSAKRVLTPLNLVDFWAYFAQDPVPPSTVNPTAKPGGRGLGVVLAGREARRSLPLPVLADLTQTAFGILHGPKVYLLGQRAEQSLARQLLRSLPVGMQARVEDLSGKTDWPGLVEALSGLDAVITPDTGSMHLAAHLGVPVLAFFLSSAWLHETGPYGEGHYVWQAARACAPCLESAPCPCATSCGQPFVGAAILRSLALVLGGKGRARAVTLPLGLQLWQTATDALGAKALLMAGEDAHARRRAEVRALLMAQVGLPQAEDALEAWSPEVQEWFFKDADWMLPPGRYC